MISATWLVDLAERKLGSGAIIRVTAEGWVAVLGTTRVTAKTRDTLVWFLEQMPDRS
jgi:hypothetical protein